MPSLVLVWSTVRSPRRARVSVTLSERRAHSAIAAMSVSVSSGESVRKATNILWRDQRAAMPAMHAGAGAPLARDVGPKFDFIAPSATSPG